MHPPCLVGSGQLIITIEYRLSPDDEVVGRTRTPSSFQGWSAPVQRKGWRQKVLNHERSRMDDQKQANVEPSSKPAENIKHCEFCKKEHSDQVTCPEQKELLDRRAAFSD